MQLYFLLLRLITSAAITNKNVIEPMTPAPTIRIKKYGKFIRSIETLCVPSSAKAARSPAIAIIATTLAIAVVNIEVSFLTFTSPSSDV
jgi:hypothetical protein